MKITKISQQLKRPDRYSVFVDEKYSFSLSEGALLNSGIASGRELTANEVNDFKQLSQDDKIYGQALRYIAMRSHTTWEMQQYLERKAAPPALIEQILSKLTDIGLLDDYKYAASFARDRRLLRSSSRRKIIAELKKKRVADGAIEAALGEEGDEERTALVAMIERKRRQTKYQDDTKLMQYLARQGYGYGDIKSALSGSNEDY
ncbi:MAG: RecX family transcriptional regulator [Patescibacteria group bacterium]|nr:RecX family transcriptional regulator [Patescibacteria group bacterium]